eukprot:5210503-Pyramimonas_sp.AAC.1
MERGTLQLLALVVAALFTLSPASGNALEHGAYSSFLQGCCHGRSLRVGMYVGEFSPMWRFTGNISDWEEVPGDGRSTFFVLELARSTMPSVRVIFSRCTASDCLLCTLQA